MMINEHIYSLIFFVTLLLSGAPCVYAQSPCYETFLKTGKKAEEELDFEDAIAQYKAALGCPEATSKEINDKINQRLQQAQNGYIEAIKAAQQEAERQATIARQQAALAEANRLAYLSDQELANGNARDALGLAYLAYEKIDTALIPKVKQSWGEAVFANFKEVLEQDNIQVVGAVVDDAANTFLARSLGNDLLLWDRKTGIVNRLSGHTDKVYALAISDDGELLASGGLDSTIYLWNRFGKRLDTLKAHRGEVLGVTFSSDGKFLLSWGKDGSTKLWNIYEDQMENIAQHNGPVLSAEFSVDEQFIISRGADKKVGLWSFQSSNLKFLVHQGHVYKAFLSPVIQKIVTCSSDAYIRTWNLDGSLNNQKKLEQSIPFYVGVAPGKQLIAATHDGMVNIWNKEGEQVIKLKSHEEKITGLALSPNGSYFLTASHDQTVKVWQADGELISILDRHMAGIREAKFSPDGNYIMSLGYDGSFKLWDLSGDVWINHQGKSRGGLSAQFFNKGNSVILIDPEGETVVFPTPVGIFNKLNQATAPELSKAQKEKYNIEH